MLCTAGTTKLKALKIAETGPVVDITDIEGKVHKHMKYRMKFTQKAYNHSSADYEASTVVITPDEGYIFEIKSGNGIAIVDCREVENIDQEEKLE